MTGRARGQGSGSGGAPCRSLSIMDIACPSAPVLNGQRFRRISGVLCLRCVVDPVCSYFRLERPWLLAIHFHTLPFVASCATSAIYLRDISKSDTERDQRPKKWFDITSGELFQTSSRVLTKRRRRQQERVVNKIRITNLSSSLITRLKQRIKSVSGKHKDFCESRFLDFLAKSKYPFYDSCNPI